MGRIPLRRVRVNTPPFYALIPTWFCPYPLENIAHYPCSASIADSVQVNLQGHHKFGRGVFQSELPEP